MPSSPDRFHLLQRLGIPVLLLQQVSQKYWLSAVVCLSLTPRREVPGFISGRFLTTGLSLPLAEISAAGSLVATGLFNGTPELPSPLLKNFS
jgi:hypothetical protein